MKKHVVIFSLLFFACFAQAQTIDLSGLWEFQIDRKGEMRATDKFDDQILLPGSMPERLKGDRPSVKTVWTGSLYDSSYFHNPYMRQYQTEENFKLPFFLTPARHYEGVAWYRRTVNVPREMAGQRVVLFLERPHIITTLFIDGREVGSQNSLCVAHEYDVTDYVKAGKTATIALRIDNDHKKVGVGQDSHSVTDQTQGNWNGVTGRMELRAVPRTHIEHVDIFPEIRALGTDEEIRAAKVKVKIVRPKGSKTQTAKLNFKVFTAEGRLINVADECALTTDTTLFDKTIHLPEVGLWDEFTPNVHTLQVALESKGVQHEVSQTFGLRKIETRGKEIYLNERPTLLRGTVENCDFPMTGYAPMEKDEWLRVFKKCREYGLNHIRFHSFCPPEAAFEAADELGLYLQPEGPSWPNHGVRLGSGQMIDQYLMEETQRMVEKYGNHPSFTMLACGNEPAGNWVPWVSHFVDYWRATDDRRIYTGASVGGGWAWQPKNQYHVKAGARGLDNWRGQRPESMSDFLAKIDTVSQPFVSHETGQWCAFPDLDETDQYTGAVNKAKNFEIFRDILRDKGMEQMARRFLMSSGKLQVLCYKAEIERTLRTPNYAGYQLLALNDYSGQGSALVGPLNVFFREKGYVTSKEWREFSSPVTLLAEFPKFVYWENERIAFNVLVSNYGQGDLKGCRLEMTVSSPDNDQLWPTTELIEYIDIPIGLRQIKSQEITLGGCQKATVRLRLLQKSGEVITENHWDLWTFSRTALKEMPDAGDVLVKEILDAEAEAALEAGRSVLLLSAGKVTYGDGIVQQFTPVFWNTSWFKMRPPHTTGMYINQYHPIFRHFPTEDFSDMQWWDLMNRQQVMLMDNFPKDFMPIVQPIDTWFLSRKLGMLFEARVGNGRLMMTTMPLQQKDYSQLPVIAQMRSAVLQYMQSPDFRPETKLDIALIRQLFTEKTPVVNMFTNETPDELKPGYNKK